MHLNRADEHGNATYLGPDPYFDDLFVQAADKAYVSCEQIVDTAGLTVDTPVQRLLISRMMVDGVVETPNGAHFTICTPDYERDEKFQKAYAAAASGADEDWAAFERASSSGDEAAYQAAVAAFHAEEAGDERRSPAPRSAPPPSPTRSRTTARSSPARWGCCRCSASGSAKLTSNPDLVISDGESLFLGGTPAAVRQGGRRRGLDPVPPRLRRGRLRQAPRDDGRDPGRPARQPEHLRDRRLRAAEAPAARLARRAGQHGQQPDVLLGAQAQPAVFVEQVDIVSGVGPARAKAAGPGASQYNDIHRIVTNLGVLDVKGAGDTVRLLSVHPGVTVDEVRREPPASSWTIPDDVPMTREPTEDELILIREVLDPKNLRDREVPA